MKDKLIALKDAVVALVKGAVGVVVALGKLIGGIVVAIKDLLMKKKDTNNEEV